MDSVEIPIAIGICLTSLSQGKSKTSEELAHIIGQKEDGPRGDDELPLTER